MTAKFDVVLAREPSDVPAWMPDAWREDMIEFLEHGDERSALIIRRGVDVSWYLDDGDRLDGIARELQAAYAAGLAAASERGAPVPPADYQRGRDHERLDLVDFLQHPPGRIPDHWKTCVAELLVAVKAGRHVGGAKRLYDKAEREPAQEGGKQ